MAGQSILHPTVRWLSSPSRISQERYGMGASNMATLLTTLQPLQPSLSLKSTGIRPTNSFSPSIDKLTMSKWPPPPSIWILLKWPLLWFSLWGKPDSRYKHVRWNGSVIDVSLHLSFMKINSCEGLQERFQFKGTEIETQPGTEWSYKPDKGHWDRALFW